MKKRMISMLLAIVMVLGMLPAMDLAANAASVKDEINIIRLVGPKNGRYLDFECGVSLLGVKVDGMRWVDNTTGERYEIAYPATHEPVEVVAGHEYLVKIFISTTDGSVFPDPDDITASIPGASSVYITRVGGEGADKVCVCGYFTAAQGNSDIIGVKASGDGYYWNREGEAVLNLNMDSQAFLYDDDSIGPIEGTRMGSLYTDQALTKPATSMEVGETYYFEYTLWHKSGEVNKVDDYDSSLDFEGFSSGTVIKTTTGGNNNFTMLCSIVYGDMNVDRVEAVGTGYGYDSAEGAYAPIFESIKAYNADGFEFDYDGFTWSTPFYTTKSLSSANKLTTVPQNGETYYFGIYIDQYLDGMSYGYTGSLELMDNSVVTIPGFEVECVRFMEREMGSYLELTYAATKRDSDIYVGGVKMSDGDYLAVGATTTQTTKPSGGYAYYKDGTLTLNNYSYEGKGYRFESPDYYATIYYADQDLTLELVGTNTLTQTASKCYGIRPGSYGSRENLTIQGDGSLNVTSTYSGIFVGGSITVNGGTIISTATYGITSPSIGIYSGGESAIINSGSVTATGDYGLWLRLGGEINGGTVTATGIEQAIKYSTGFTVAKGMKIQASTTVDGELGEYVAENHDSYKKIIVKPVNTETIVSSRVESILSEMTLEEKITQMMMVDFRKWGQTADKATDFVEMNEEVRQILKNHNFGGVLLFSNNIKETQQAFELVTGMQAAATANGGIAMMISSDHEGGNIYRLGSGTALPGNMALGATYAANGTKYALEAGKIIGSELSVLGINANLAPVVDVNNNANNPVIGLRSYGDDAVMVGEMASATIAGMAQYNVIGAARHFPGHGDTDTDSHYGLPMVDKSLAELKEVELKPYEVAIDEGIEMIMTAHILYPQLESDKIVSNKSGKAESLPATMSDDILTYLLKGEMGFDGIIVTDAMNMAGISANWDEVQSCVIAIQAGVDLICMPTQLYCKDQLDNLDKIIDGIIAAVEDGTIPMERINDAVARILTVKENRGLLDYNAEDYTLENAQAVVGCEANREMEREMSAAAVTVVKNDGTLPLQLTSESKVLMMVPYNNERAQMLMAWNRAKEAGLIPAGAEVDYVTFSKTSTIESLKEKMDWADTLIINSEISSTSRYNPAGSTYWLYNIPNQICDYAAANGKKAIISSVDKPYDVQMYANANAIVAAYGCKGSCVDPTEALIGGATGSEAAYGPNIIAAVEVILGTFAAQGKLPVNIPVLDMAFRTYTDAIAYERGYGLTYDALIVENPFTDVKEGDFYYDPVMWAVENGITSGATATTFNPGGTCLRAQVVTFLHRAAGNPEPTKTNNPFKDVKSSDFFYKPVLWAVEKGITNGTSATTFGSYDTCNRAAVVTFLWRAQGSPEPTSTKNPFVDVKSTDFFYKAVLWAVEKGITNGIDATHFGPTTGCNRAQVVTFLYRAYK